MEINEAERLTAKHNTLQNELDKIVKIKETFEAGKYKKISLNFDDKAEFNLTPSLYQGVLTWAIQYIDTLTLEIEAIEQQFEGI